jgi:hypothetical protein
MTELSRKAKEISFKENTDLTVNANGVSVEMHIDGSVLVYSNGPVKVLPLANDYSTTASTAPKPGDKMPDGTIYAGVSPDTNKPMYATPADAPLTMTFNEAQEYAAKLYAHGHKDWRVPTKAELNVLFNSRAKIGGFDLTGSDRAGWYCSIAPRSGRRWSKLFKDGYQNYDSENHPTSLRCVR